MWKCHNKKKNENSKINPQLVKYHPCRIIVFARKHLIKRQWQYWWSLLQDPVLIFRHFAPTTKPPLMGNSISWTQSIQGWRSCVFVYIPLLYPQTPRKKPHKNGRVNRDLLSSFRTQTDASHHKSTSTRDGRRLWMFIVGVGDTGTTWCSGWLSAREWARSGGV